MVMRWFVLGGIGPKNNSLNLRELAVSCTSICGHYIRAMFVPFPLSPFYDFPLPVPATLRMFFLPLAALIALAALVGVLLWKLVPGPRRNTAFIALVWIVVPGALAMQLNRLQSVVNFVQDRYMYLPSIGFAMLLALALRQFASIKVARIAALAIAVSYAALTVAQEGVWADEVGLYSVAVRNVPEVNKYTDLLANALMAHNRCPEAVPLFEQVIARDPSVWNAYANIGNCYIREGDVPKGISYLERAAAVNPDPLLLRQIEVLRRVQQEQSQRWATPGS
jgi:hypothetical protein